VSPLSWLDWNIPDIPSLLGALLGLWLWSTPVAAHETGISHVGGRTVDLPVVLAVVTTAGTLGGLLAVYTRDGSGGRRVTRSLERAVGPLLAGLGIVAAASVVTREPAVGLGGVAVGVALGVPVATLGGCGVCADTTIGAVAVHRFVEGVTLAVVSAAGSSVALLAVVVLAGHTVAECIAVGGHPGLGPLRAVGGVLLVGVVFVSGALLGSAGLVTAATLPGLWLVATAGGLLTTLGLAESRLASWRRLAPESPV
jgi:hypothetical protein